ncbi:SGNH/GDSL hydrolase family protein [Tessaracoccus sp. OS52]|uniref:SGNH/GDSL hydrolase family protein n=1 Tax=Tessaracoccus sp. OS52 TaxID=2886691 RepID=UPI001D121C7E|nr:SGNH/GDSL hydrolase family protein [Tessaracoccus sp. OS52]MCC2594323.1 SGNH/GDSL hydrolase family protein [Tessaracoccus sp. OS52]
MVIIGDSYSMGEPAETWVGPVAESLGWTDVVNLSSPGRGFVMSPRSCDFDPCGTFALSIPAIVEAEPDIVVTFGGTADGDYGLSEAASAYFDELRQELPEAELIAISPVTTADSADYWLTLHNQTIGAGVEDVDGTFINVGQPGLGDGEELSPQGHAEIAQAIIEELS